VRQWVKKVSSIFNGWGAFHLPLSGVEWPEGASNLDTGIATLTALISQAITSEMQTAWSTVVAGLPETSKLKTNCERVVGSTIDLPPEPQQLTQTGYAWPLLAVYRSGDPEDNWMTTEIRSSKQEIHVDWILGPMDIASQRRFRGFLLAFLATVREVVRQGRHPDYDGGNRQFSGVFYSLRVLGASHGIAQGLGTDGGGGYYAASVRLEAVERELETAGGSHVEFDLGYVTAENATGEDLVGIDVEVTLEPPDAA
jgi:hypothetical protein